MTKTNSNRLKLAAAIVCIALAIGSLQPIYLMSKGLLDNAVALDERTHFEMKLTIYLFEIVFLCALAAILWRSRKP